MIGNAAYYIKKGVLKTPVHFQFCMGCANGIAGMAQGHDVQTNTMIYAALPEFYAILALVGTFLI